VLGDAVFDARRVDRCLDAEDLNGTRPAVTAQPPEGPEAEWALLGGGTLGALPTEGEGRQVLERRTTPLADSHAETGRAGLLERLGVAASDHVSVGSAATA